MATFTAGQTITVSLDNNDSLQISGKGVATVTPSSGSSFITYITGTQYLGPYQKTATVSFVAESAGSYSAFSVGGVSVQQSIDSMVSNDSAVATANTTILQNALNAGGLVQVTQPGTYYINATLVIGSNTTLKLSDGVTIKLTGGSAINMIATSAWQQFTTAPLTGSLSWTAGKSVNLTWTGHGLSVGDYVFVWSSTLSPSAFAGVFPVTSVVDANTVTLKLWRTPATGPTGTVNMVKANVNVVIDGGNWDQNYPSNSLPGNSLLRKAIEVSMVAHAKVRKCTLSNIGYYSVEVAGAYDFELSDLTSNTVAPNIIKVYGPAVSGVIQRINGTSTDDTISIQSKESVAFIGNMPCWGDLQNIHAQDNTVISTGANGFGVFYSANEWVGGISVDNISGTASAGGVAILPMYASSVLNDIVLKHVHISAQYEIRMAGNGVSGTIQKMSYYDGVTHPDDYTLDRSVIFLDTTCTINSLNIVNFNAINTSWSVAGGFLWNFNGTIGTLNIIGGALNFSTTNGTLAQFLGSGAESINATGVYVGSTVGSLFRIFNGTPTISLQGCDINSSSSVVSTNVACTVSLTGNRLNVGTNGVVRSNAAVAIKVKAAGNNWVTSNVFSNGSGTGLWEFYGLDIPLNLSATGIQKTVSGQHAFNTAAAAGTIVQNRLATCNGTNWVQVDTPANVF